jgi:hypothetical protein
VRQRLAPAAALVVQGESPEPRQVSVAEQARRRQSYLALPGKLLELQKAMGLRASARVRFCQSGSAKRWERLQPMGFRQRRYSIGHAVALTPWGFAGLQRANGFLHPCC